MSRRVVSLIKREIHRNPLQTSKQVFEAVGMFNVVRIMLVCLTMFNPTMYSKM